jgi:prevent-host-death family protein
MTTDCKPNQKEKVDVWAFVEGAFGFLADVAHDSTQRVITVEGKPVAAIVSLRDLDRLNRKKRRDATNEPTMP